MAQIGLPRIEVRVSRSGMYKRLARAKRDLFEGACIFAQRHFAFRPAVEIVEKDSRQPLLGEPPQIVDIDDARR